MNYREHIIMEAINKIVKKTYRYIIDTKTDFIRVIDRRTRNKIPFMLYKTFNNFPDLVTFQSYYVLKVADKEKDSPQKFISIIRSFFPDNLPVWILEYKEIWDLIKDNIYIKIPGTARPIAAGSSNFDDIFNNYYKGIKIASKTANISGKIDYIKIHIDTSTSKISTFLSSKDKLPIKYVTYKYKDIESFIYGIYALGQVNDTYVINDKYKKIFKADKSVKELQKYFINDDKNPASLRNPTAITIDNLKKLNNKFKLKLSYGSSLYNRVEIMTADKLIVNPGRYPKQFVEKILRNIDKGFIKYLDTYIIIDDSIMDRIETIFENYYSKDLKEFLDTIKLGSRFKKVDPKVIKTLDTKTNFSASLYPHQQLAVSWMYNSYINKLPGVVLADDMGLGKTPMTIAFLTLAQYKNPKTKISIVCPASMVGSWKSEIEKFNPKLKNYEIMSYEKAARSLGDTDILILDEAQKVKNHTTIAHQRFTSIKKKFVAILSGTPIENKAEDIVNILGIVDPVFMQLKSMTKLSTDFIAQLRKTIDPIYLQRKKSEIKDMNFTSKLIEKPIFINPSKDELDLINEIKKIYGDKLIRMKAENNLEFYETQVILVGLMRIRQAISYPGQLPDDLVKLLSKKSQQTYKKIVPSKYKELVKLCENKVAKKEKVIVFSEFTGTINYLKDNLSKKFKVTTITGSDSSDKRKETIDEFQKGQYDIIIVSLKAGNSGITLHAANNVVIYDLWYNPQVLAQAVARAHRIGQTKDVEASFLVLKKTFDDRIWEILDSKRGMIKSFETGNAIKDLKSIGEQYFTK